MSKFRFKSRGGIIAIIAFVALFILAAALAVTLFRPEMKTIGSSAFSVGGLNDAGEYVENDQAIYTKNLIECDGLTIERDFESTVKYEVFFYDEEKIFIESSGELEGNFAEEMIPEGAKYCRIMITPEIPEDVDAEDFKIGALKVRGYAKQLTVKVDRKQ